MVGSFAGTNTLAYYKNSQITAVKNFITLAPGVDLFFSSSLTLLNKKPESLSLLNPLNSNV
jgi:hypothetical protein